MMEAVQHDHSFALCLTDRQRQRLRARRLAVEQWEAAIEAGAAEGRRELEVTPEFLSDLAARTGGEKLSRSTLYNWRRAYRDAGLWGLVDQRWLQRGREQRRRELAPFFREVARRYLSPGLWPIAVCHEVACEWAERHGRPTATLRETSRYIRRKVLPRLTAERGW
jgi:hypothetical protein